MRGRSRKRRLFVFGLGALTMALLACNAIIGVSEVSPLGSDGGRRRNDSANQEDDGDVEDPDGSITDEDEEEDRNFIALGFLHGCGRLPSGSVKCWGYNADGELGVNQDAATLKQSHTALEVEGLTDVVSIASGNEHTCVVRQTGKVLCWGGNKQGQLGNGTLVTSLAPAEVSGIDNAKRVICGREFTCALLADRTVSCWGLNNAGQLGDDTLVSRPVPGPVKSLSDVVSLAAGSDHACAVHTDRKISCWGKNDHGQLGNGTQEDALVPTKLPNPSNVAQVAGAVGFSCARQRTGKVWCWGQNVDGQLGSGSANDAPNPSPIALPSLSDAVWIWTGFEHACAVRRGGEVVCWGRNREGQLGIVTDGAVVSPIPTPTTITEIPPAEQVFTGGDRACAFTADLSGTCWGPNALGQCGNGTFTSPARKTPMAGWP